MDRTAPPSLAEMLSAAQDWWREAGVDYAYTDEPANWLQTEAEEEKRDAPGDDAQAIAEPVRTAPAPPAIGGDPANWPQDLAAFFPWWINEPSLDTGGVGPRIAPIGQPGAKLMVLVAAPEAEDSETLLSGPQGRLLRSFFSAAGLKAEEVYLAAGLPRRSASVDLPGLADAGLAAVTLHHISLVAPERILAFGRDVLPLLGHNPAQNPQPLEKINHKAGSSPVMVARNLELMLHRPATRSRFWQRWLDWTG